MRVILPKERVDITKWGKLPLFFLAGPILGGDDWQWRMAQLLGKYSGEYGFDEIIIATPSCRFERDNHSFQGLAYPGDPQGFEHQRDWEEYYLDVAAGRGCIVFWLPEESTTHPRTDGQPYARDTRFELGFWCGRLKNNFYTQLAIGAESGFLGIDFIERYFQSVRPDFKIYQTLEETAEAALKCARQAWS